MDPRASEAGAHQHGRDCLGCWAGLAYPGAFWLHLRPVVPEGPMLVPAQLRLQPLPHLLRFSCWPSLATGSAGRCPGPAAIPVLWLSLPLLELEEEHAALSQASSAHDPGEKSCLPHGSPWLSDTGRLCAQETLGRAVGGQGSESTGSQLRRMAMSHRTGWLILCNRGKCHKEMRPLQTSLLGQISGPMWKFVLCIGSASKQLRNSPWAFSWQPPPTSARRLAREVPGAQEQPRKVAAAPPGRWGLGTVSLQTVFSAGKGRETREIARLCVGKLVRPERRAPVCTPS
ncbi:small integral membrane protein 35 isoform X1 [Rissa tridactyla]|uniref:small integral membrane protein 35 isoform X1 n=1 Tax=Rissa tridactyla TaxID=75485 RepID=UPI0023BA7BA0|nr:small integral membrane protein 35 isoform X1 [Rissa tridactyla]